jgi:photoactive yellow protein
MLQHIERITHNDLAQLSPAEFDDLPFGMIRLDQAGNVKAYNAWEARLARRDPKEVIGKNFFTDIAPCTNVGAFRGKLDELVGAAQNSHVFDYDFMFPWGIRRVRIRFVVQSADERWVLVTNAG